jgi:uncharacterized protein
VFNFRLQAPGFRRRAGGSRPDVSMRKSVSRSWLHTEAGISRGKRPKAMALVIRRSKIHADGVYTTAPIKKRHIVVEYTGPRLTIEQADAIYEDSPRTYLFGLTDSEHAIDGDGIAAFINHSCDPNCEPDEIDGRIFIRAVRNIAAGEELSYDYNLYDGNLDDGASCLCGARHCRGSLYSARELKRRRKAGKGN